MARTNTLDSGWQVTALGSALGAEVVGVDLGASGETEIARIRQLLLDHLVLFFPEQQLTMDQHVAFRRRFGELEGHPNLKDAYPGHPEIVELVASKGGIADEWHTDLTFMHQPSVMSVLHMVKCPPVGGDTMWTSLYAAFEGLSPPLQDLCEGLTALHDAHPHGRPEKMAIHPIVRVHPETGHKALYVNEHFTRRIVEMSAPESDHLLPYLTRWVSQPRFTVRHRWSAGTIAIWDNRCTQHFVLNDFAEERIIQRVTVMGDQVDGPPGRWPPWKGGSTQAGAMSRHDRQLISYYKQPR